MQNIFCMQWPREQGKERDRSRGSPPDTSGRSCWSRWLTRGWWRRWWRAWPLELLLRKKKKFAEKRERLEGEERESRGGCLVVVLASCGGAGGGSGWWLDRRGERRREKNYINGGRGADFWPTLDPIFSSFRPWNTLLFIGGGRWIFCL